MSSITLKSAGHQDAVLLSNRFIDHYMPEANGEFVKIYLYLLRVLSQIPASFSLSQTADRFNCTERDVLRGLKYWAKEGLITLTADENGNILSITLVPIPEASAGQAAESPAPVIPETAASREPQTAPVSKERKVQISRQRREELSGIEDIQQLLFLAEQYLGKTLNTSSVDKLLYFYDNLKFSADLIEYLIEYCVSKGHPSMRYIETVAFAWADKGISTVEEARRESSQYNQDYYTILKALGITNRSPVESEIRLMNTWKQTYGFTLDIITEACSRTVLQTGQSSFQYADRILSDWSKKGVTSPADIEKLDLAHQRKKSRDSQAKPAPGNRFNNFHQRNYDFQEYEKRLLNQ